MRSASTSASKRALTSAQTLRLADCPHTCGVAKARIVLAHAEQDAGQAEPRRGQLLSDHNNAVIVYGYMAAPAAKPTI